MLQTQTLSSNFGIHNPQPDMQNNSVVLGTPRRGIALILAFEYEGELAGAMIDACIAIDAARAWGLEPIFITDIEIASFATTSLATAIGESLIPLIVRNVADLDLALTRIEAALSWKDPLTSKELFERGMLYYTGHGVRESMVLPDRSEYPFLTLRESFSRWCSSTSEIFSALDCCNPSGLHLPFHLVDNVFRLSQKKMVCTTQKWILITACEETERAYTTGAGSAFTRFLFQTLKQPPRNLTRLVRTLTGAVRTAYPAYSQTIMVYSAFIQDPLLWGWVGNVLRTNITLDQSDLALIVT